MNISVQLTAQAASAARRAGPEGAPQAFRAARAMGVELRPVDPDGQDPLLATFYQAAAPDPEAAERVLARLRQDPAVVAAYLKPPDALP